MAQWDKEPDLVEKPANPELNPLMNPTLGRNLGQWAQVYFTTPPEKRDEAVGELLRQLNAEGANRGLGVQGGELPQQIACTTCGYTNPGFQKFCGMCGATLNSESPVDARQVETREDRRNPVQSHGAQRSQREEGPFGAQSAIPIRTNERDFGMREPAPVTPVYRDSQADSDLDWLRSRDVLGTDVMETEPSRVWKVMIVLAALVLVGFAFMYARGRLASMRSQQAVTTSEPTAAPTPAVSEPAQEPSLESRTEGPNPAVKKAAPAEAEPQATADSTAPVKEASKTANEPAANESADEPSAQSPTSTTRAGRNRKSSAAASRPAAEEKSSSTDAANQGTGPAAGGGNEELQQAQRYLEGNGTSRNTGAAAQLLWKAVAKKNSEAVVLLADLYSRGDGVPKSCDQARLLLTTAVKKGTPGAASRLQSLSSTCQ